MDGNREGLAKMRRLTRSGLVVLSLLAAWPWAARAADVPAGGRLAVFVPVRPQTREELAHWEALRLYALGQMRVHDDRLVEASGIFEEALALDPEATPILKALVPLYLALSRTNDRAGSLP